jgi:hypothetical protein
MARNAARVAKLLTERLRAIIVLLEEVVADVRPRSIVEYERKARTVHEVA